MKLSYHTPPPLSAASCPALTSPSYGGRISDKVVKRPFTYFSAGLECSEHFFLAHLAFLCYDKLTYHTYGRKAMQKNKTSCKFCMFIIIALLLILTGCLGKGKEQADTPSAQAQSSKAALQLREAAENARKTVTEPAVTDADWSGYFDGINGTAVLYDPSEHTFQIYNRKLALTRHSPCSTFKIISSLIALEGRILHPDHSERTWSGEIFWNADWNRDMDFSHAFQTSCVWYFRELINEIGKERIGKELDRLQYGNCDISDWNGKRNTNNNNPALTGFWIESSLLISPKEQTEVMERIFSHNALYSQKTQEHLKQVMLLTDQRDKGISIYGKTGMGKEDGVVVDSWFTGFADLTDRDKQIYYCVYLGETANKNVSSAKAREIAVKLLSDTCAP